MAKDKDCAEKAHNEWRDASEFIRGELGHLNKQYQEIVNAILLIRNDLSKFQVEIVRDIGKIQVEIGMLKVKSSIWGLLGGTIPVVILIIIQLITKFTK
jgi:archaellum component FlaC